MDVANLGLSIPMEHGVDGLAQLGAAALEDTAGIHPGVLKTVAECLAACLMDFVMSSSCSSRVAGKFLEADFLAAPGMRKNGVFGNLIKKLLQLQGRCVDQSHGV